MDAAQQLYHTFKQRISVIADPDPQRSLFFLSFVVVEDAWLWSILCACGCASWLKSLCIPHSTSLPVCTVFYVLCETDVERRLSAARDLCESLDVSPLLFPLLLSSYPLYLFLCIVYVLFFRGLIIWSVHNAYCVVCEDAVAVGSVLPGDAQRVGPDGRADPPVLWARLLQRAADAGLSSLCLLPPLPHIHFLSFTHHALKEMRVECCTIFAISST